MISLPRRGLVLPALVYNLAYQVIAGLPTYISKTIAVHHEGDLRGIAFADSVVLITSFGLRVLVLYPAFAAYVYSEIRQVDVRDTVRGDVNAQERSSGPELSAYGKVVQLCFKKTAVWFGLLHLQMVFVLAGLEIFVTPLVYKMIF